MCQLLVTCMLVWMTCLVIGSLVTKFQLKIIGRPVGRSLEIVAFLQLPPFLIQMVSLHDTALI